MNLQERMKKYAASFKDEAHCYTDNEMALYSDLQSTVQALEVAREALSYAIWQCEGKGIAQYEHLTGKTRRALQIINKILGKD